MTIEQLKEFITETFDNNTPIGIVKVKDKLDLVFKFLNTGQIRIAEKIESSWIVNSWIKKAILLNFRLRQNVNQDDDAFDKIGLLKFDFENPRFRKVKGSTIRDGVYIGNNAVIMPSYINVGAYIGNNTMIDINSAIGSCAQIGANCHISALSCIGGVLEPVVSNPVIIEDNCFIGAQSSILEGVIVEENSVIASGVTISGSTKIIDINTGESTTGRIKSGSVVVAGSYPKNGINISCAVVIKKVDAQTKSKSSLNDLLREIY